MMLALQLLLFYTILMVDHIEACNANFDFEICGYRVICNDEQIHNLHQIIPNSYIKFCTHMMSSCNDYYSYKYPIYLLVEGFQDLEPKIEGSLCRIVSLELTHSDYIFFPNLKTMENLVTINISRNSLVNAKFSNANSLQSLTTIDFSHNDIKDFEQKTDIEYVFKNLEIIDLSYNSIITFPRYVFDELRKLKTLKLSHNKIVFLSPMTFEGLRNLVYLDLEYNFITDVNASLFRFGNLEILNLSNNNIKNIKLIDFVSLISLKSLDLSYNSILILEEKCFYNMSLLQSLDLSNNKLESLQLIYNENELTSFDISNNDLKSLPKALFENKNITMFSIKGNHLEGPLLRDVLKGLKVTELDLSNQRISSVEDYSFVDLGLLTILLLNDNNITYLSKFSMKSLQTLHTLDLSNNKISDLKFDKSNLDSLLSLSLKNNNLTIINYEDFDGLTSLEFLDISSNKISHIISQSFYDLNSLINFKMSDNPLSGNLDAKTFEGMNSLPILEMSYTSLANLKNSSFYGLVFLKTINISHSKIEELQYNAFLNTGSIEVIDLSHNLLINFEINSTELTNLQVIYLNNNHIMSIKASVFLGLHHLSEIFLMYNNIENIQNNSFSGQKDLRILDLSFNPNLKFNPSLIKNNNNINILNLSGSKCHFNFTDFNYMKLYELQLSNAVISNVTGLYLKFLKNLTNIILRFNDIAKIEVGAFSDIYNLEFLDLSHNNITFIQPGAFKDNKVLRTLNISHNSLNAVSYGIFRGLTSLNVLDMSYNSIRDLQSERFYELIKLSILIVDHNKINQLNEDEFFGINLRKLSIGDNPLPCDMIINYKSKKPSTIITAINLDENNNENVYGITCNVGKHSVAVKTSIHNELNENRSVLIDIRDILLNTVSNINMEQNKYFERTSNNYEQLFKNIKKYNEDRDHKLSSVIDLLSTLVNENNNTNIFLRKILFSLNSEGEVYNNVTYKGVISDINNKLEVNTRTAPIETERVLPTVNTTTNDPGTIFLVTENPRKEKLLENLSVSENKSVFIETCVVLNLLIVIGIVLHKFYNSRMFIRDRLSMSTRELPNAVENSAL